MVQSKYIFLWSARFLFFFPFKRYALAMWTAEFLSKVASLFEGINIKYYLLFKEW